MDVKFGKVKPSNFLASSSTRSDVNFFETAPEQNKKNSPKENSAPTSRMNDFDSNILENNAYQALSDEMLKLEHKIGLLETLLSKLNSEIDALESLGHNIQIADLIYRKQKAENELAELNKKYSELGLGAKISGQIASVVNFSSSKKQTKFSKIKTFIFKKVLSKISKRFDYSQTMKEALDKLSNINSNVDELITMKVPYGETINRYEKLTAYLNKANIIHSQISKNMDEIAKKKAN